MNTYDHTIEKEVMDAIEFTANKFLKSLLELPMDYDDIIKPLTKKIFDKFQNRDSIIINLS